MTYTGTLGPAERQQFKWSNASIAERIGYVCGVVTTVSVVLILIIVSTILQNISK